MLNPIYSSHSNVPIGCRYLGCRYLGCRYSLRTARVYHQLIACNGLGVGGRGKREIHCIFLPSISTKNIKGFMTEKIIYKGKEYEVKEIPKIKSK